MYIYIYIHISVYLYNICILELTLNKVDFPRVDETDRPATFT